MRKLIEVLGAVMAVVAFGVFALTPAASAAVPVSIDLPQVTGAAVVGSTLSTTPGTWSNSPDAYEYIWWRCVPTGTGGCVPSAITGATAATYVLTAADIGASVYPAVRAHNADGWSTYRTGYGVKSVAETAVSPTTGEDGVDEETDGQEYEEGDVPGEYEGEEGEYEGDGKDEPGSGVDGSSTIKPPAITDTRRPATARYVITPGLAVRCSTGTTRCVMNVTATTKVRRNGTRRSVTIGHVTRTTAAGVTLKVSFTLNANGRRLLRTARRLVATVKVRVEVRGVDPVTLSKRITIRRP